MADGCSLEVYNHSNPRPDKRQEPNCSPDKPLRNAVTPSAQYGINVFALGLVLTVAEASQKAEVTQEHTLAYLSTLMAIQLAWMFWYFFRRRETKGLAVDKDHHAGPGWLRGTVSHRMDFGYIFPPVPGTCF